jgi:subtilisin family serine protease
LSGISHRTALCRDVAVWSACVLEPYKEEVAVNHRAVLAGLVLVAATACADATSPSGSARLAPLAEPTMNMGTQLVPGEYIVVLNDGADVGEGSRRATAAGGQVVAQWANALRGYAVRGGPSLILSLRADPNVRFVEQVQEYTTQTTQTGATWGLDRIDQRSLPLSGSYTYGNTGTGVTAYIIDTGIRLTHNEFGGRASFGANYAGGPNDDCNGHGTHVAGTVGGKTYGVAKGVKLVAVKVLGCSGSGSTTGVVSGINWVAAEAAKPAVGAAVANMSLGGGKSSSIETAVNNAVSSGVAFAVAAGNSNANACNYSPAGAGNAITVGATTSSDARASYSNFGTCLDIFAPGSSITSAWKNNDSQTKTISGTSMASPHVAGVAALYLQSYPGASGLDVRNALVSAATTGVVTSLGSGSPNRLLFTNY